MFDRLQSILGWFSDINWKIIFLTSKIDFRKFLRSLLTHFGCQGWENAQGWLLRRSQTKFWNLKSKICSQGFVRNVLEIILVCLTWSYDQYWPRDSLKTEKKQNRLVECPFEIIGFTCWPHVYPHAIWPWGVGRDILKSSQPKQSGSRANTYFGGSEKPFFCPYRPFLE